MILGRVGGTAVFLDPFHIVPSFIGVGYALCVSILAYSVRPQYQNLLIAGAAVGTWLAARYAFHSLLHGYYSLSSDADAYAISTAIVIVIATLPIWFLRKKASVNWTLWISLPVAAFAGFLYPVFHFASNFAIKGSPV